MVIHQIGIVEHHIQLMLRHFINRDDTVYDVGANRGWLSVPMSRLVGQRGFVACFEASARNIRILTQAIIDFHITNSEVINMAVFHESGMTIDLHENQFSNADSIYFAGDNSRKVPVHTLALNDYYELTALKPKLIKMDIEGAEYDALVGASRIIGECRPILIIELRREDLRPFRLLIDHGYKAFNLKSYTCASDEHDFCDMGVVEDYLFIHNDDLGRQKSLFLRNISQPFVTIVAIIENEDVATIVRNVRVYPGINCFRLTCVASRHDIVDCQVLKGSRCVVSFRGGFYLVCEPYLTFVVYSSNEDDIDIVLCSIESTNQIAVSKVEEKLIELTEEDHRHHKILEHVLPFGLTTDSLSGTLDDIVNTNSTMRFDIYLKHLLQNEPNHPRLLYLMAVEKLHDNKLEDSLNLLNLANEEGFDKHWCNLMKAVALIRLNRMIEAREAAKLAEQANPNNPSLVILMNEIDEKMASI